MTGIDETIAAAVAAGAAKALRAAAERNARRAADGTVSVSDHPGVLVRTSEAAFALRQAESFAAIADDIESGSLCL